MIYVNVDSPNLGFPYFNFLEEAQWKKSPCINAIYAKKPIADGYKPLAERTYAGTTPFLDFIQGAHLA